ncbi:DUF4440 domain-containing protein [Pseudoalteromonas fenneropenaei]|uniref:DUF4440 domain-containing protein n=1 Tax=Pseudoalteromonas fenneropenaei TaxID=1737459 RepID=A0ABV7CEH4_9GAMM
MQADFIKLEQQLHLPDNRSNRTVMDKLIHTDFVEIGLSGHAGDKQGLLAGLEQESLQGLQIKCSHYEVRQISTECYLVRYFSYLENDLGEQDCHASRSSIWRLNEYNQWQLTAHFASKVEPY